MTYLVAGLGIFFIAHFYSAFRSREPAQDIKMRLGADLYMSVYSLISVIGLGLIVFGYWSAPSMQPLYVPPPWTSHVVLAVMATAFVLIVAAYVPRNHFKAMTVHPMLLATGLWAGSHLLVPTDTKEFLLFGSFLLFAVIDGASAFGRSSGSSEPAQLRNDAIILAVAAAAFSATAFWLHAQLLGVSPW